MIIYKIENKVNGKIYIGQTIGTLEHRLSQHKSNSKKKSVIGNAIQKKAPFWLNIKTRL